MGSAACRRCHKKLTEAARALYRRGPSAAELAAFGLVEGDLAHELELWPEHVQPVQVFAALSTQWRSAGMGGVMGLDYAAIPPTLELLGIARTDWPELFAALQVMERAAMDEINRKE